MKKYGASLRDRKVPGGALPSKGEGCIQSPTWKGNYSGNIGPAVSEALEVNKGLLNFDWTLRYGEAGEGDIIIKLQLENPDGTGFGYHYIQTPEGCYDAVAPELKSVNGLSGFEVDSIEDGSSGSSTYMCTQEGPDMICGDPLGYNPSTCSSVSHNNYMCTKTAGSTETQGDYPYSFCRFDSYTNLEVGDGNLPPSMLATVLPWYEGDDGNKTWKVNLDGFKCDPTGGVDYCVITKRVTDEELAMGLEHEKECYSWDDIENLQNQCEPLNDDPQCTEVEKTCAEGWLWKRDGQEDICFAYTTEYQCKEDISHTVTSTVTENSCAATLPCIGGDCDTANQEANDQFADALAMATVIQHMEDGMNCEDPSDPSTCTIFEGEGKFCSWEPSGLGNDCCEAPDGVDIYEYAKAAYGMLQADTFVAGLDGTSNAVVGGYQSLREPIANAATTAGEAVSDAYSAFTSTFTDAASTAAGNAAGEVVDASGASIDILSDKAIEKLKQQTMNYMRDALPDALSDALFDTATDTATGAAGDAVLSEGASQAVTVIGYVYAAYMVYQYIKLALNLLTACHEYEMDMGVRIATKQCIKVGKKYCAEDALGVCYLRRQDYCCYDSILSRIIMEQASPMLGHDLEQYAEEIIDGSKIRSCPGLTPDQLSSMDWNKIDLSEWINIMIESGIADFDQDMEKLTGSGRMLNNEGRENIVERTTQRAEDAELSERAIETRTIIKADDIDCSYIPRPLACYFNDSN